MLGDFWRTRWRLALQNFRAFGLAALGDLPRRGVVLGTEKSRPAEAVVKYGSSSVWLASALYLAHPEPPLRSASGRAALAGESMLRLFDQNAEGFCAFFEKHLDSF